MRATGLDCSDDPYSLQFGAETENSHTLHARAVVIASGATYRTLELPNGGNFDNSGIDYAANTLECDLCRNQEVIVVGGWQFSRPGNGIPLLPGPSCAPVDPPRKPGGHDV